MEEGARSSRPHAMRKPRVVSADSQMTTYIETPNGSETPTRPNSQEMTPSKRARKLLVMTDEPISPELRMPKPGHEVDAR